MAEKKLKVEQVGPKQWKFADPPCLADIADEFSVALDLLEEEQDVEAEKIFRKLIKVCPLHIDAHHHLALLMSYRGDVMTAFELWGKAVEIGMKSLPEEFVMGEDRLEWSWLENRPFLRAYYGLAMFLFDAGRNDSAHLIFNHLLAMNPNDNQGVRALAVENSFAMDRPDEALQVCDKYENDGMADTVYGRSLALFGMGRKKQAEKALIRAVGLLPEVARELLRKRHRMPKDMSFGYITVGGADEAYDYWQRMGRYWKNTDGALAFLADVLSRCQVKASPARH